MKCITHQPFWRFWSVKVLVHLYFMFSSDQLWASHTTITSTEDRHKRLSTGNFRRSGTSSTMVRWPSKTKVKVRRRMASKMLPCVAFKGALRICRGTQLWMITTLSSDEGWRTGVSKNHFNIPTIPRIEKWSEYGHMGLRRKLDCWPALSNLRRFAGSVNTIFPNLSRSMIPSAFRTSRPNSETMRWCTGPAESLADGWALPKDLALGSSS